MTAERITEGLCRSLNEEDTVVSCFGKHGPRSLGIVGSCFLFGGSLRDEACLPDNIAGIRYSASRVNSVCRPGEVILSR